MLERVGASRDRRGEIEGLWISHRIGDVKTRQQKYGRLCEIPQRPIQDRLARDCRDGECHKKKVRSVERYVRRGDRRRKEPFACVRFCPDIRPCSSVSAPVGPSGSSSRRGTCDVLRTACAGRRNGMGTDEP